MKLDTHRVAQKSPATQCDFNSGTVQITLVWRLVWLPVEGMATVRNLHVKSILTCIALQPLLGPGPLKTRPHSPLSASRLLHLRIPRICNEFVWTTSAHLVLGFPTDFVLWNFPLRIFPWDPFSLHSYDMTHPSQCLLILISSTIFRLFILLFHLCRQ
jgi:hypothetical protein